MEEFYTFKVFKDGDAWCAIFLVHEDIAPPERCEGRGSTIIEAMTELINVSGIAQQPRGPED